MPATSYSVLEFTPATNLRPGETGIRLKDDPYYGKVDIGPATDDDDAKSREFEKKERARISTLPAGDRAEAEEKLGKDLAKRREKKAGAKPTPYDKDDPLAMPTEAPLSDLRVHLGFLEQRIEDGSHALSGEEQVHVEVLTGKRLQQRAASGSEAEPREPEILPPGEPKEATGRVSSVQEPAERDRDKTKAGKPGESVKDVEGERLDRERAKDAKDAKDDDKGHHRK